MSRSTTNGSPWNESTAIDVTCDDLDALNLQPADVVLANLTAAVLVRYAGALAKLARSEGYLILSGFAPDDHVVIGPAFAGTHEIERLVEGDWSAVCLQK